MSQYLLDTHIWLWYMNGNKELSRKIRDLISEAICKRQIHVAAISLWEIAMLDKKKRIIMEMPCLEWINRSIELISLQVINLTPEIAADSCCLPGKFQGDPADRLIVASARIENMTLITKDKRILSCDSVTKISA